MQHFNQGDGTRPKQRLDLEIGNKCINYMEKRSMQIMSARIEHLLMCLDELQVCLYIEPNQMLCRCK